MRHFVKRSERLWSMILAGGEGERVRPLVQAWLGRHLPKQYCTFVGRRSMFQHTVDRAGALTAPEQTVTVIAQKHQRVALTQLEGRNAGRVVLQPKNRDTAAGIFLPLTYIRAQDPSATVVIYPSDHFVYPEDRFLEVVQRAAWGVESMPDRVVLLGFMPDRLELEYGWIQPGEQLRTARGYPVWAVHTFLEKPSAAQADAALTAGAFWNTLVMTVKVDTLWQLGWWCFPDMMPLFERLAEVIDTADEGKVLEGMYDVMPAWNFSTGLLQRVPEQVAVMELRGVLWSDWGKPQRIVETLRRIDKHPAFPLACLTSPFTPIRAMNGEVA